MDNSNVDIMSDSDSSDTSGSNIHSSSSDTSSSNSATSSTSLEPARILKQHIELPKGLSENPNIFDEFFSLDTWNNLPTPIKDHLNTFLPTFSDDPIVNQQEQQTTINQLFNNEIHRFGVSPLKEFQKNLDEGNYRPDISRLRSNIEKSQRRERKFQECEHVSRMAQALMISREKLLRAAYDAPPGTNLRTDKTFQNSPKLSSTAASLRAKKRYFQEIINISEVVGLNGPMSDDENYPEGPPAQLSRKQRRHLSGIQGGATSPGAESRVLSTMAPRGGALDHLVGPGGTAALSEEFYRQIIYQHKKRKLDDPDHPELVTSDITLRDVHTRTQLSAGHRRPLSQAKVTGTTKKAITHTKIKSEPPLLVPPTYPLPPPTHKSGTLNQQFQQQLNKSQSLLMIGQNNLNSNSESEDEIQIKQERMTPEVLVPATVKSLDNKQRKRLNSTSVNKSAKKIVADNGTMFNLMNNSNNPIVHIKEENITILHDSNYLQLDSVQPVQKPSTINLAHYGGTAKAATLSDLKGIDMMHLPVDFDDSGNIDILNEIDEDNKAPELMQETHACFLSLIRDIFCSTQNHRTSMDNLQSKVSAWLANPITALNDWYSQADNWLSLLPSAIHFLAGEFLDQPEDFVPYLEYKLNLHIYQWIGAGRDSDQHLNPLCEYWLIRRNEMGTTKSPTKHRHESLKSKHNSSGEFEDSGGSMERPVSPPPPRFPTNWTVHKATNEEIEEFRAQERRRFDNPHLSFTYRMHGFESVVGPVKGIYTQIPALTKARGHNMLTVDRPNFVTILTLVRDATARLPNGEGTRADICELLKSSQYINPAAADNVLQTIVSGALDRMHTEHDPCVRYDPKRKIWIYLHRNRTEEEFERMHQQFQGISKHKKQSNRKVKNKSSKSPVSINKIVTAVSPIPSKSIVIPKATTSPPATTKIVIPPPALAAPISSPLQPPPLSQPLQHQPLPPQQLLALSSIQSPSLVQISNQPPMLNKLQPKKPTVKPELVPIKPVSKYDKIEHIDVEASLEAHTTPILVNKPQQKMPSLIIDNKIQKIVNKTKTKTVNIISTSASSTTPIKVSTSSGIQTVHVSAATNTVQTGKTATSLLATSNQSILVNQNRSQSPLYVANKKVVKPPPLIPQSTPSLHCYIPINISNTQQINKVISPIQSNLSTKIFKTAMPALTSTSAPKMSLLQQNKPISRVVPAGKSLISPSVAAANISLQQQQKLVSISSAAPTSTIQVRPQQQQQKINVATTKGQQATLTTAQQRQILQNIISQQQKPRPNTVSLLPNTVVVSTHQQSQMQQPQLQQQQPKTVIVSQQNPTIVQKIMPAVTNIGNIAATVQSPTSTPPGTSLINPQIIQIHQANQQQVNKVQTVSASSLTPQQQQNLLQSIKQQQLRVQNQQASATPQQQSFIIKQQQVLQQIQKQLQQQQQQQGAPKAGTSLLGTNTNQVSTIIASATQTINTTTIAQPQAAVTRIIKPGTSLIQPQVVQTATNPISTVRTTPASPIMAKVLTNASGQIISLESLLQKQGIAPGTTLRVAGAKPGQTSLIQLAGTPGSQITQYAVVSQGRNIISLASPQRLITTQTSTSAVNTSLSATLKTADARPLPTIVPQQHLQTQQIQTQQIQTQQQQRILQSPQVQSITTQQLVNAKVLGVQGIAGNRMKPGTGIRMVNASNLNIAHIGGKPVIIAGKPQTNTVHQQQQQPRQNVIWQNAQANNSTNFVIGGQTVKVQGNILSQFDQQTAQPQTQTVMFGNQVVKLQSQNQVHQQQLPNSSIGSGNITSVNNSIVGNSGTNVAARTVVLGTTGQSIRVHSPAQNQATGSGTVTLAQQQHVVLGQTVKNAVKGTAVAAPGQQRVVLAVQGGGQILLPPGFQGGAINLKSLQGLKVIPIQQQNKVVNDDRQLFAQIISSPQAPRPPNPGGDS